LENAAEKTFWSCHVYGANMQVKYGTMGEFEPVFSDDMTFASAEESLEKKNSYLERRLEEGYKIAGSQKVPPVPVPLPDEAMDEEPETIPEAEPVVRAPTPRKRPAEGTPASKKAKAGTPKEKSSKKAATPKAEIQKAPTPKKATTSKKAGASSKKEATPKKSYGLRSATPKHATLAL
jgi:hypothetical protein